MANASKLNNVRFQLDFGMIPKIFYKDPFDFAVRCRRVQGEYICALFNRYYEVLNPMHFPENPKHFTPGQFTVSQVCPGRGQYLMRIDLPDEHEGSLEYCLSYVIAWRKGMFGMKDLRLYAIERTALGLRTIGAMEPDGTHTDHGPAGTDEENLAKIAALAFG